MNRSIASALAAAMASAATLAAPSAWADQADPHSAQPENPPDVEQMLRGMSIEQLARLPITTVAKHPEALNESAAAVFVISREDIRRSGAASLPEVLRLAPNLEVAQLNGYTWNISARGFDSQRASNKLLVLVDGRSVQEPVGSSVLWQQVDVPLDEIERIEVVSGPGGALWGAGAVNGVINIITRRATDSQRNLVAIAGGDFRRTAQLRYGAEINPDLALKVYAQGFDQSSTRAFQAGDTSSDAWRGAQGGFRLDGRSGPGGYTVQGDLYRNVVTGGQGSLWGDDVEARYNRPFADGSSLEVMGYYARDDRTAPALFESRDTYDLQAQHNLAAFDGQAIVWGGEARLWHETYVSQDTLAFAKPTTDIVLGSVFAQDEVSVRSDLKLTLGLKLEESSYSGFEWLPNIRMAWTYRPGDLLWAALSRSVRTPDRVERELQAPGSYAPSPDFTSEKLTAFEAGWRGQPTVKSSFSVSTYYNIYDDLRTDDLVATPNGPLVLTANGMRGVTYGVEAWGKVEVVKGWRLNFGTNALAKHFKLKAGVDDISNMEAAGQDPGWQAQIRSEANLTSALELDATVRSIARVEPAGAPGYTEGDARLAWRLTPSLQVSLDGRNLFSPRHLEAVDLFQALPARYIGRTFYAGLRWGF
jgi:iron complex outermembrane receptor protein